MKQKLIDILKQNKIKLIIEATALILQIYLLFCPSKYLGNIIDLLSNIEFNKKIIIQKVLLILITSIGVIINRLIYKKIDFYMECKIRKDLTDELFNKLMKMRIEDVKQIKNGEIMSYFVRDVKKISRQILRFFTAGIRFTTNIIIVIVMITKNSNIKLAICAVIPILITIISLIFIRKKIRKNFKDAQQAFTEFSEYVQENTDSIRTIKAFAGEKFETNIFQQKNKKLKKYNQKVEYFEGLLDVLVNLGIGISYTIVILLGSRLVLEGRMTVGDIVSFMGYLTILEMPMYTVPWVVSKYDEFKISISRLDKIFNMQEEKLNHNKKKTETIKGNIEIKDLTFHYPDALDNVLSDIIIDIKEGETLGIIGVIGSGKTTLMNLLLKLYNVPRGKITIGGMDINDIPTDVLRDNICYITQENFLFSASLKENINLFKDNYKDEEIEESTKNSMIYDDIKEMKDGVYTVIGEKGIDLSGGQKQRVALSRAFLNNTSIVIFDDTFSALDNRTEQKVLKNIKRLVKNKTCIIVSNRISDIKDCDNIIVMENGRIIEKGSHDSLLKKNGSYNEFYKSQAYKIEELT